MFVVARIFIVNRPPFRASAKKKTKKMRKDLDCFDKFIPSIKAINVNTCKTL